jgi:hypothetical protein
MARSWGSKSVEAQIDMAENRSAVARAKVLSNVSLDLLRKKESILMSRTRVVRDLENAQNPRYRAVLSKALKDLDAQLSTLAAD